MASFDSAHKTVHYPDDRRFCVWIHPAVLAVFVLVVAAFFLPAWGQWALTGLPTIPALAHSDALTSPQGFPLWLRICHYLNFAFVMLLIRSGICILMDHPRLYFNDHCTPGSEWLRLTPIRVPKDRVWTAKDDARYISPLIATPGYRHSIGIARIWHFLVVHGFIFTGVAFMVLLFATGQWQRLVPTSPQILSEAWSYWVHYATLHMPPEPNGFYAYNALQQLAYFAVVFIFGPLAILTGIAMSPAVVNRFPSYARLFGGRQAARSIHFLLMLSFVGFIAVHVGLVVLTGFMRNMNHIVLGTDNLRPQGMIFGLIAIALVVLSWFVAHYLSWKFPRQLQHALKRITYPMQLLTLNRLAPGKNYTAADISPYFWPNGKRPTREDWKIMARGHFQDFRLRVDGLVERPANLSLEDLAHLGASEQITMHHCIQGWSGIAQWGGIPMKALIAHVRPLPEARVVVFYSFGDGLYGGAYYDTQTLDNALQPSCLLATHMNGQPLPDLYGAPLRLRVENQLGYKMVKWIERIEFVASEKVIGLGEGGKNEDDEYFDLLPNI